MKQIVTKIDNKTIVQGGGKTLKERLSNLKPHEVLMVDNHDGTYDFITRDKKYSEGNAWKLVIPYYNSNGVVLLMANRESELEQLEDGSYIMTLFAKELSKGQNGYDAGDCYISSSTTILDNMIMQFTGVSSVRVINATSKSKDAAYYDLPLHKYVKDNIVSFIDNIHSDVAELIISEMNGFPSSESIIRVTKFRIKEWV